MPREEGSCAIEATPSWVVADTYWNARTALRPAERVGRWAKLGKVQTDTN